MENTASQLSCISRPASMSAGESSCTMHFAGLLQASSLRHGYHEMDRQRGGGGVSYSSFSSSFDSLGGDDDDDSFITSDIVCQGDEVDDPLQDTACSSAVRPEVTGMGDTCIKPMVTTAEKHMSTLQLANCFVDASSRQKAIQEVISGGNNNESQLHGCNDLRKRGLCLVPISMLIDYLG